MTEAQNSSTMSTSLHRLATLAQTYPERCFINLNQYLTHEILETAYRNTRKDGAVGVDKQTAQDYEKRLQANLKSLLSRAKTGRYQAPPVKRAYIPKGKGQRPIGIPTFEDKVLQRAVTLILEPLYEPLFHTHSYGYRRGRSAHQALHVLREQLSKQGGGHVIELDIQAFFDNLDKHHLRTFLKQRIGDGVILRLINKWLKAGVMEAGSLHYPDKGSPQGGVISPILANIYLHHVLDQWVEQDVKPRLLNDVTLIRFADDAVIVTRNAQDAKQIQSVLSKRFNRYGLQLHPEKTRLTVFKPGKKSSIDFLGLTHFWKCGRKGWGVSRKTMKSRYARAIKTIKEWCKRNRFQPIQEQYALLCQKVQGHYAYYGISGNIAALKRYRYSVEKIWIKWLRRRSQRHRLRRKSVQALLDRYCLPMPRIITNKPAKVMN
jgi:group II intron reverse transcriptase/maturase